MDADGHRSVDSEAGLHEALGPTLGPGRAIALIGGAEGLDDDDRAALEGFFLRLAEYLERTGTAVVDGGTDSGVMRMIASARRAVDGGFRLVGILPEGVLHRTTRDGVAIDVAQDHEIVLVPGTRFGDESRWLFAAADHLADCDAPTIVVNGGRLTLDEAADRLASRARVVVVEGSGRTADALAADAPPSVQATLRVLPMTAGEADIRRAIHRWMETTGREDRNMAAETRGTPGTSNSSPGTNDRMSALLATLELSPFRKDLLRQRWLDQVLWSSRQARRMRVRHYALRLPIVIGGVAVPGLISVSLSTAPGATGDLRQVTFLVSLMVAILAALEGVFQFGERWRHYRRTAERLKSAGWQFLMLNGPYRRYETHEQAFVPFTERVEEILGEDVEGYLGQLATEGPDKSGGVVN